jgi:co-chaperonin GroES (HSP10)
MKTFGENFFIKYNKGDIKKYELAPGIVIQIEAECNTDVRGYHEQIGIIACAPEGHDFFKEGDRVLTHYLSSDKGNEIEINKEIYHRVTLPQIFLRINEDDSFTLAEDIYLCEYSNVSSVTESGILTTFNGEKKEDLKLIVTNLPSSVNKRWADDPINVGDVLMPQDNYNYTFTYKKKEYVKIEHKFIMGVYGNKETTA